MRPELGLLPSLRHCFTCRMVVRAVAPLALDAPQDPSATERSDSAKVVELAPAFRVEAGVSTESMAFQVAAEQVLSSHSCHLDCSLSAVHGT